MSKSTNDRGGQIIVLTSKSFAILGYRAKSESNHEAASSLRIAGDEQLYQVSRTDQFSSFNCVRFSGSFGKPLLQMATPHVSLNCFRR